MKSEFCATLKENRGLTPAIDIDRETRYSCKKVLERRGKGTELICTSSSIKRLF